MYRTSTTLDIVELVLIICIIAGVIGAYVWNALFAKVFVVVAIVGFVWLMFYRV